MSSTIETNTTAGNGSKWPVTSNELEQDELIDETIGTSPRLDNNSQQRQTHSSKMTLAHRVLATPPKPILKSAEKAALVTPKTPEMPKFKSKIHRELKY